MIKPLNTATPCLGTLQPRISPKTIGPHLLTPRIPVPVKPDMLSPRLPTLPKMGPGLVMPKLPKLPLMGPGPVMPKLPKLPPMGPGPVMPKLPKLPLMGLGPVINPLRGPSSFEPSSPLRLPVTIGVPVSKTHLPEPILAETPAVTELG